MEGQVTRHQLLDPDGLPPAVGFSHGVLAAPGRLLHVAGQIGVFADGSLASGLVAQFAQACRNLARVVEAAGGSPQDVVAITIYTTDLAGYRAERGGIGAAYRAVFGDHYPAMALIGVGELFEPAAVVELVGVAVVPES